MGIYKDVQHGNSSTRIQAVSFASPLHMSVSTEPLYCNIMKSSKDIDKVLDPGMSDEQSDTSDDEKVYKVRLNLIPVFILESIALGCLSVLAYYLRFKTTFPVYIRSYNPCDHSLSLPAKLSQNGYHVPLDIPPSILYISCLASPLILVTLGELLGFVFSSRPRKVVRAGCIPCKMHKLTRRVLRFVGTFLFGLLATSILTDTLKLTTGIPRPYFLDACGINMTRAAAGTCTTPFWISECAVDEELVREARMSFPSLYASLSAYSAGFIMIYLHSILATRSSRLFRPALVFVTGGLALICGFSRITLHRNHFSDVIAGILLGASIALYLCLCVLNSFREYHETKQNFCCKRQDHLDCRPQPLFFRYFRIPHVSYQGRSGKSYPASDRNHCDYSSHSAMPVNAAFQRDLHQRVEDYSKRHGKQTENQHNSKEPLKQNDLK